MADVYASATIYCIVAEFNRHVRPYYVIQLVGSPTTTSEPTSVKTSTVTWKTKRLAFSFSKDDLGNQTLYLSIWDKGAKFVGGDRLIGRCSFPCRELVLRHFPATSEEEELSALKAPLLKKHKQRGTVKLYAEASGWMLLNDMLQMDEESRRIAIFNLQRLFSSKGPKINAYLQYTLLEHLANSLLGIVAVAQQPSSGSQPTESLDDSHKRRKRKHRRKHNPIKEKHDADESSSSMRENVSSQVVRSTDHAPAELEPELLSPTEQLDRSNLSNIWLSISRLDPSCRSRLVSIGVMKLFLLLLRHKNVTVKMIIMECLKPFFASTMQQQEMIKSGILDELIQLLSHSDCQIQNRAFDVLLYFDERLQPAILEKGILKALINLIRKSTLPQLKTRSLEMILYFNSDECQKEILSAGVLKELVKMSLDGGNNAKAATSLVLKVLSVIKHFDVTYREALVADHILEPIIGLLKLKDEKISLQTFSVIDEFINTHENALISAGLLQAIGSVVTSDQVEVRMKAFDTMSRLRLHIKEIASAGLLTQLVSLLTDPDLQVQLKTLKLLSTYMGEMTQSLLVEAGIIPQLVRLLSVKWFTRSLVYNNLIFDFLQQFDPQFQPLMIEVGVIENLMEILRTPLVQQPWKENSLAFLRWLKPSTHVEIMCRGVVLEIVRVAKASPSLQKDALQTLTSLSGWMAFAAESPSIMLGLFEILQNPQSNDAARERVLEILEHFPDHSLLCHMNYPRVLIELMQLVVAKAEPILLKAAKQLDSLTATAQPLILSELLNPLFVVIREAPADAAMILLDVIASYPSDVQVFAAEKSELVQMLLDCASSSKPDPVRIKCLDVLVSLHGYKTALTRFNLGKHLLSLLSSKSEAFQLRVIDIIRDVGVTSNWLMDDGLVARMMQSLYSATSDTVASACMSVIEELHRQGGTKLIEHLVSRKEPDVLDVYTARLNSYLCHPGLEINNNCHTVIATSSSRKQWRTVLCDKGIVGGIKSWEVVLDRCVGGNIMIGVCTKDHPLTTYIGQSSSFRGWSYYGGASGYTYHDGVCNPNFGVRMKQGQVIMVTLDLVANTLSFTMNGKFLGVAFSSGLDGLELFPAVSLYDAGDQVTFREAGSPSQKGDAGARATPRFLVPRSAALLNKWIGESPNQKWVLLYKASDHGWSSSEFHNRCDLRGPTITIVRTAKGAEFGGYASVSWEKDRGYKADPNAFLFSITTVDGKATETVHSQYSNLNCAIYSQTKYGPTFGNGFDLYINLDYPSSSYAHLGHTYRPPSFDQQQVHLSGTSGSWGKHDVEIYGRFTDSIAPTNVRLLNQFIRLMSLPLDNIRERIQHLLAEAFVVTHRKEVLKETQRLMGDRRQPTELKEAMKSLLSRIQFPGIQTVPFSILSIDGEVGSYDAHTKLELGPASHDLLLQIDLDALRLPEAAVRANSLPYLTHVVISASKISATEMLGRSLSPAALFCGALAPPDPEKVGQYIEGLTEDKMKEYWPESTRSTASTESAESAESSNGEDSGVEYVDPSLDKIKFPGALAPGRSQTFGPLPPPVPTTAASTKSPVGQLNIRSSDSGASTRKHDALLQSPRSRQAAAAAAASSSVQPRPLSSSIPSRITPHQHPRSLNSHMGVLPDLPSSSSTVSAAEPSAAPKSRVMGVLPPADFTLADLAAQRELKKQPMKEKLMLQLQQHLEPPMQPQPPQPYPMSEPQQEHQPGPFQTSPPLSETTAPELQPTQSSAGLTPSAANHVNKPAVIDANTVPSMSPRQAVALQEQPPTSPESPAAPIVPPLPVVASLKDQPVPNADPPATISAAASPRKAARQDGVTKFSPRKQPSQHPHKKEKEKELDEPDKEKEKPKERPSEERKLHKKDSHGITTGSRRLRRTTSSTAVQRSSSTQRKGAPTGSRSAKRSGSPAKSSRILQHSKARSSITNVVVAFPDDDLHRSAGSDSEQPEVKKIAPSNRSTVPERSASNVAIPPSSKKMPSRPPPRVSASFRLTKKEKKAADLGSSEDSSDGVKPLVRSSFQLPEPANKASQLQPMYIYLNNENQKVRTKDEAYVDIGEHRRVRYKVLWVATQKLGFIDEQAAADDCGYDPSADPTPSFVTAPEKTLADSDSEWEEDSAALNNNSSPSASVPEPQQQVPPQQPSSSSKRDVSRAPSPAPETPASPRSAVSAPSPQRAISPSPNSRMGVSMPILPAASLSIDDSAIGGSEDIELSEGQPRPPALVVSPAPARASVAVLLRPRRTKESLDSTADSASRAITQSVEHLAQSRASDMSESLRPRPAARRRQRPAPLSAVSRLHRNSGHHRASSSSVAFSPRIKRLSKTYEDSLPLSDSFEEDSMERLRASFSPGASQRRKKRILLRSRSTHSDSETIGSTSLAGTEDFEEAEEEEPRRPGIPRVQSTVSSNPNQGGSSESLSSSEAESQRLPSPSKRGAPQGTVYRNTEVDISDQLRSQSQSNSNSQTPPNMTQPSLFRRKLFESIAGSETAASQDDESESTLDSQSAVTQQPMPHPDVSESKDVDETELSDSRSHSLSSLSLSMSVTRQRKGVVYPTRSSLAALHESSTTSADDDAKHNDDDSEAPEDASEKHHNVYAVQDDAGSDPGEEVAVPKVARRKPLRIPSLLTSAHEDPLLSSLSLSLSRSLDASHDRLREYMMDSDGAQSSSEPLSDTMEDETNGPSLSDSESFDDELVPFTPPAAAAGSTFTSSSAGDPSQADQTALHSALLASDVKLLIETPLSELFDTDPPVPSAVSAPAEDPLNDPSISVELPEIEQPLAIVRLPSHGYVEQALGKAARARYVHIHFPKAPESSDEAIKFELSVSRVTLIAYCPWTLRSPGPLPNPRALQNIAEGIGVVERALKSFKHVFDMDQNGLLYWLGCNEGKSATYRNPSAAGKIIVTTSHPLFEPKMSVDNIVGRSDVSTYFGGTVPQWFCIDLGRFEICVTHFTLKHGYHLANSYLQNFELQGSKDSKTWVTLFEQTSPCFHRQYDVATLRVADGKDYFRFFRVIQNGFYAMGNGQTGGAFMCICGFELYGELRYFESS